MIGFVIEVKEYILNHVISHIPIWHVRKLFYQLFGMKIGKGSYILMGCYVMNPWKISIGNRTYINEKCFLDGRGKLTIGNNVSISIGTKILTGTHDSKSCKFEMVTKEVIIEDNVWTGIDSIILPGVNLKKGSILAAGSVAIESMNDSSMEFDIYSGVPAKKIGTRELSDLYELESWKPRLR